MRLSTPRIIRMRAQLEEQVAYEAQHGSKRALRASELLPVIQEVLDERRRSAATDLLEVIDLDPRAALAKLIESSAAAPSSSACCALSSLRRAGYTVECSIADGKIALTLTQGEPPCPR